MIKTPEIIKVAKEYIAEKYDIQKEKISDDIVLRRSFKPGVNALNFDDLDIYELLIELENHHNIHIEPEDVKKIERAETLSDFCNVFLQFVSPDISKIKTKEDVFKILNAHLQGTHYIMNAKMSDNFFIDLHFHDVARSDIIQWADETFGIKLPRTYFINLDDFCENILKCIPKQEVVKQPQNKFKMFFSKIYQRIK